MDTTTLNLINRLATTLSTSGDHIMQVLVRQAYVSSGVNIVSLIALDILCLIILSRTLKLKSTGNEVTPPVINWILCSVLCPLMFISTFICIPLEIKDLLNPEYWAMVKIRQMFAGL